MDSQYKPQRLTLDEVRFVVVLYCYNGVLKLVLTKAGASRTAAIIITDSPDVSARGGSQVRQVSL